MRILTKNNRRFFVCGLLRFNFSRLHALNKLIRSQILGGHDGCIRFRELDEAFDLNGLFGELFLLDRLDLYVMLPESGCHALDDIRLVIGAKHHKV